MIPLDSFMAHSADGRLVPVVPGGQNISLTFSNRTEYVERSLDYRLHEMDSQVWRAELLLNDLGVYFAELSEDSSEGTDSLLMFAPLQLHLQLVYTGETNDKCWGWWIQCNWDIHLFFFGRRKRKYNNHIYVEMDKKLKQLVRKFTYHNFDSHLIENRF